MQPDLPPVVPSQFSSSETKNNTLAMVSLGLGIAGFLFLCLALVLGFCACISGLLGIAALVTGYMARQQIQTSGEKGSGIAVAGMILGGVQIVLVICGIVVVLLAILVPSIGTIFSNIGSGLK